MLSCLRVAVLHEDEIEVMDDNEFNSESTQFCRNNQASPLSSFYRIVGREHELRTLRTMHHCLNSLILSCPTTLEDDELLLINLLQLRPSNNRSLTTSEREVERTPHIALPLECEYDSDEYWKLLNAVKYRLTRKRIISRGINMANKLISWFEDQSSNNRYCKVKKRSISCSTTMLYFQSDKKLLIYMKCPLNSYFYLFRMC